ncbi:MAG: hypothetical protein HY808_13560 [Nitrospirae bacterium]|nr:hypothetical protein [Nitrospirota bacterium]
MSQMPEQYHIFVKLHEAFLRMCDVSIKTLEIIEREKGMDTAYLPNLRRQMENLVIGNLNLFQDKVFIEKTQGDKIMNQSREENIEIRIGDKAHISGGFVVAKSIENSFNKVASSDLADELKELLQKLSIEIGKIIEHLPKDEAEDVAEDLSTLIDKATSEKPKRKWWSVSIDGLSKAAEKLGKVGMPVLELVGKIVPLLERISS